MDREDIGYWLFIGLIFLLMILSGIRGIFVDQKIAVDTLEKQGFSDVKITEKDWFMVGLRGCDGGDAAKFVAEATNPIGKKVEIYVCSGWPFKGATIRNND